MARIENKYWIKMRLATEEMIKANSVSEIAKYIKANGDLEEANTIFYRDGKSVHGRTYEMSGDHRGDEFIVSDTGRVFWINTCTDYIEVFD